MKTILARLDALLADGAPTTEPQGPPPKRPYVIETRLTTSLTRSSRVRPGIPVPVMTPRVDPLNEQSLAERRYA